MHCSSESPTFPRARFDHRADPPRLTDGTKCAEASLFTFVALHAYSSHLLQTQIHGEPDSKVTKKGFKRFLVDSPLEVRPAPPSPLPSLTSNLPHRPSPPPTPPTTTVLNTASTTSTAGSSPSLSLTFFPAPSPPSTLLGIRIMRALGWGRLVRSERLRWLGR